MPSPFPGMDPFIESQAWEDFHGRFVADVADCLVPRVRPRYVVRYEKRVYSTETSGRMNRAGSSGTEHEEAFLTIRERDTLEVVTVVELLSPANKRAGSDGRRDYLKKRDTVLKSIAHLVELDLLRGGLRLPTVSPLPPGDYYVLVCRAGKRPKAEVYAWSLRQALPRVPIPLKPGDADVTIDLQDLFAGRFDRSGYDYSLDVRQPVEPPLSEADALWVQEILQSGETHQPGLGSVRRS